MSEENTQLSNLENNPFLDIKRFKEAGLTKAQIEVWGRSQEILQDNLDRQTIRDGLIQDRKIALKAFWISAGAFVLGVLVVLTAACLVLFNGSDIAYYSLISSSIMESIVGGCFWRVISFYYSKTNNQLDKFPTKKELTP
jgi:hypothetical protein